MGKRKESKRLRGTALSMEGGISSGNAPEDEGVEKAAAP